MEPSEPSPVRAKGYKLEQNTLISFCNRLLITSEWVSIKNEDMVEDIRQSYEKLDVKRGEIFNNLYKPFLIRKFAKVLQEKIGDNYLADKDYRYIAGAYAYANEMGVDLFDELLTSTDNGYVREHKLGKWVDASLKICHDDEQEIVR